MPKIGMGSSTVLLLPWAEALELAIENEFEAFEMFGEFPQCVCAEVTEKEREQARALIKASGISLAVHAPFTSLNIAALNPGIRRESVCQTLAAIDLCADLGGSAVVVHNGEYVYSDRVRKAAPPAFEMQWNNNAESLKKAAELAEARGVTVCLENIGFEPEHMDKNVDDMLRIKDEVGSDALNFCLDIGHARLNNELEKAIEKMGPHVGHVHFTDNFGKRDDHVVIGDGDFDYAPVIPFIREFDGIVTLEVVKIGTDPAPALVSREYLLGLLG